MQQDLSEILDEAARTAAPIFNAWSWVWKFGATERTPDAIDIRRKLDELSKELDGLTGERSYEELTVRRVQPPEEDYPEWDVLLRMAKGTTSE